MTRIGALLLVLLLAAGCARPASVDGQSDAERAVDSLGLQATQSTGIIRGFVVDEAVRPLANAEVVLNDGERTTTTNDGGAFGFASLDPGTYLVTVSLPDYQSVQQSATVLAGVNDPSPVKVVLAAVPRPQPYLESYSVQMFKTFASPFLGLGTAFDNLVQPGSSSFFESRLAGNASFVQMELSWSATSSLGQVVSLVGATRDEAEDPVRLVGLDIREGRSPLATRVPASDDNGTASSFFLRIDPITWRPETPTVPDPNGAAIINQKFQAFAFVFHNFQPDEDWTFARDGPYPVPRESA